MPSFAIDAANFSRRDYWRGPAWFNVNWLLTRSLANADRSRAGGGDWTPSDAARAAAEDDDRRRLRLAMRNSVEDHGFREYWDPISGAAHGASAFSWTAALYLDAFCARTDAA